MRTRGQARGKWTRRAGRLQAGKDLGTESFENEGESRSGNWNWEQGAAVALN